MTEAKWTPARGDRKRVVVVGAGVAGMTCAHELVERGYEVEVVEMAADPHAATAPLIGGMARTSWGRVPASSAQVPIRFVDPTPAPVAADRAGVRRPLRITSDSSPLPLRVALDEVVTRSAKVDAFVRALKPVDTLSLIASHRPSDAQQEAIGRALGHPWHLVVSTDGDGNGGTAWAQLSVERARVPGEHGFRFFPSFYRHLFDTMKRIPIEEAAIGGSHGGVVLTSDSARSVFDALLSAEVIQLALAPDGGRNRSFEVPRRPLRSPGDLRTLFANVLERAGYRGQDLYRLATRYAEYLTSSAERRRGYEDVSWATFLELEGGGFSEVFLNHVRSGAQALVAMSAETNDARTIGSIAMQLTLDQLRANPAGYTDATLRGPTSLELFEPWRAYLASQSVRFTLAHLVGFYGRGMAVRPAFGMACQGGFVPAAVAPADYYVVTVPIDRFQALFAPDGRAAATWIGGKGPKLLSRDELFAANRQCLELDRLERRLDDPPGESADDIAKYLGFDLGQVATEPDTGPLRYMCGIQFYFEADVRSIVGHTLCLDSPWGVSHISQVQYWQDRTRGQAGLRGVMSVIFTRFQVEAPDRTGGNPKTALQCTPDEIAERVWKQIGDSWNTAAYGPLPEPGYYYLDENLSYSERDKTWTNATPYLVNRVGEWPRRGGVRMPGDDYHYRIQLGHLVFAGAFMRTTTRLNTMEAANESGRRAANAILDHDGSSQQRARLWPLEGHELAEAAPLRELDRRIVRRGGHHVLRHAGVEAALRVVPWDLVRFALPTGGEDR